MLGAEEDDDLCRLRVAQRIREGWHLLSTVLNLLGDLGWRPELVFSNIHQRWRLPRAFTMRTVTTGAALIAEQDCAGHFIDLFMGGKRRSRKHCGEKEDK